MRLCHVSDTHGWFRPVPVDAELIVHSGDFLPNKTFGIWSIETAYQPKWIEDNSEKLKQWAGERPLLITHGNHDFINTVPHLQAIGIDAHQLDDRRHDQDGVVFYGFPHVPAFSGQWNYETSKTELTARTEAIDLDGVNVLVAHSPIFGVLDRNSNGNRCGSIPMWNRLQNSSYVPEYFLCGHIHEAAGRQEWSRGITVYNAATAQYTIDL